MMNKDQEYVLFPCQKPSWDEVRNLLEDLKTLAQQPNCNLQQLAAHHQRIVDLNEGILHPDDSNQGQTTLHGLVKFLKKYASAEEKRKFLHSTLPAIVDLVLEVPNVLPDNGLAIASQQIEADIELSRRLVACILACAFLCLFEDRGKPWKQRNAKLNVINFTNFFKQIPSPAQNSKLRCILDYFDEVSERQYNLHGNIRFIRQVIPRDELPTLDAWLNCEAELCPLIVHHEGCIEDAGSEAIEVDFANRFIGGGVLGMGKVQEEIRFTVCPELISSMLFMECMEENEAIIIQGYEQFTKTEGYSHSLQYAGKHQADLIYDRVGNLITTLCAIDAVSYRSKNDRQYSDEYCIRDLNKAYVGFSFNVNTRVLPDVVGPSDAEEVEELTRVRDQMDPQGPPPSGVCNRLVSQTTEDEYFTASENEEESEDQYVSSAICNLADGLMVDILSSALLEASSIIHKKSQKKSQKMKTNLSIDDDNRTSSSSGSKTDSSGAENMDHLDVDLHDWVSRFRRRSSNLSDIGSRRSSCSTRYSSDFSSEFEEYYENFQKKEQQVIHNTIKEEVCHPVIAEFAANLVSKLLAEGTVDAVNKVARVQKFDDSVPYSTARKPKARKVSDEAEESTLQDSDLNEATVNQDTAEKFADSLLSKLLTFPNGGPNSSLLRHQHSSNISPGSNIPNSQTRSPALAADGSDCSEKGASNEQSVQNLNTNATSDPRELYLVAGDIVHSAISSAITVYQDLDSRQSIPESSCEDQVVMASSYSSKHSTDSEISQGSSVPGSSFFLNRGNLDLIDHPDESCDKKESVIETCTSVSPSKGEKKNVQFHEDIVGKDKDIPIPVVLNEPEGIITHSRTVSESSTSMDSAGQPMAIPKLIVSEEVSSRNGIEEMYGRVAEKLILTGFSSALKDVQEKTGQSYEGASLTFSATNSQPEHSVYVQGGNLVYPGEILRGDSYEDVTTSPRRFSCFASSLSRDLLTNAFIEVQRNVNGGGYARRSSEPLKISNQAARQLMEENNGSHGHKEKSKSRTEEDIGTFADELAQSTFADFRELHNRSCGFRDPTLSRFAEELMKTECTVPEFQILDSTNVSVSGSSVSSFHSSKSGFRDPVLSSFEGELLTSNFGRSSGRSSLKRKSRSGSLKRRGRSGDSSENFSKGSGRAAEENRGVSFDSDISGLSWRSQHSPVPRFEEVSSFADRLAKKILVESLNSVFRDVVLPPATSVSASPSGHQMNAIKDYADSIALSIIAQTLSSIAGTCKTREKQTVEVPPNSELDEVVESSRSSGEYCDALAIPLGDIENFAEQLAHSVLQSSIGVIHREQGCASKRHFGRPIATGNWGCGAFRGDPHLKAMLQWMAASYAGVPYVLYYTFQHEKLIEFQDVVDCVLARGWRVGQLMQAVRTYCMACQDLPLDDRPDLFNLFLDKTSFQDIT